MSACLHFSIECLCESIEKLRFVLTALRSDLRIEIAICAEASAEGDMDVYHGLSEHELGRTEECLLCVSLDCVDTLHVSCDVVEIDAHLDFLALIVDLT